MVAYSCGRKAIALTGEVVHCREPIERIEGGKSRLRSPLTCSFAWELFLVLLFAGFSTDANRLNQPYLLVYRRT